MSITTVIPTADDSNREFDEIYKANGFAALDEPGGAELPPYRPSRATFRREAREAIDRGLGFNRHRTTEREV